MLHCYALYYSTYGIQETNDVRLVNLDVFSMYNKNPKMIFKLG